jgi:predicted nucleic acid-binding protein
MPEVIADTSPIQYLYQIAQLDLLPTLYGQIKMPQAVVDELTQGRDQGISLPDPIVLSWITLCSVPILIPSSLLDILKADEDPSDAVALLSEIAEKEAQSRREPKGSGKHLRSLVDVLSDFS